MLKALALPAVAGQTGRSTLTPKKRPTRFLGVTTPPSRSDVNQAGSALARLPAISLQKEVPAPLFLKEQFTQETS
jgi:hypothetical protein